MRIVDQCPSSLGGIRLLIQVRCACAVSALKSHSHCACRNIGNGSRPPLHTDTMRLSTRGTLHTDRLHINLRVAKEIWLVIVNALQRS